MKLKISKDMFEANDRFLDAVEKDDVFKAKKYVKKMADMHKQSIERELTELYWTGTVIYGSDSKVCKVTKQLLEMHFNEAKI